MNELALFSGAGGGILGGKLLGWRTKCAVEIDAYRRKVLLQRQCDGILDRFPIWDDVRTFNGYEWRGEIDIITGGFPCQDISAAGKGAGIGGERSGLWTHMARIVGEVQPRYVLVENSPLLVSRGLDVVLADLAAMGFDAEWGVIGAHHAGAPHKRDRIWILAYSNCNRCEPSDWREFNQNEKRDNPSTQQRNRENEQQRAGESSDVVPRPERRSRESLQKCSRQLIARESNSWWDEDPADIQHSDNTRLQRKEQQQKRDCEQSQSCNPMQCRPRFTQPRLGRVAHGVAHNMVFNDSEDE